jgi:hypothetical protein
MYALIVEDSQGDNSQFHWYCKSSCNILYRQIHGRVAKLQVDVAQLTTDVGTLDAKVDNLEREKVDKLQTQLDQLLGGNLSTELRKAIEEIVKSCQPVAQPDMQVETKAIIRESVGEIGDRERRKNNIIFFNVEESTATEIDTRKQHDVDQVQGILEVLELGSEINVTKPVRLSKSKNPAHLNKPRPLRVTVPSHEDRENIIKKSKNLAGSVNSKMKLVYAKRDQTPLERTEHMERRKRQTALQSQEGEEEVIDNPSPPLTQHRKQGHHRGVRGEGQENSLARTGPSEKTLHQRLLELSQTPLSELQAKSAQEQTYTASAAQLEKSPEKSQSEEQQSTHETMTSLDPKILEGFLQDKHLSHHAEAIMTKLARIKDTQKDR